MSLISHIKSLLFKIDIRKKSYETKISKTQYLCFNVEV